jgi:ubiquinone/menaquinone biosynthesis C-methylase UbiE
VQKFLEPVRNKLYYRRFAGAGKKCGEDCKCESKESNGHDHSHSHGHGHSHDHHNHGHGGHGNHGPWNLEAMDKAKTTLFQALKTTQTAVPELKGKGMIRILEIGVGPGANFKFYPEKCEYIGVDPNTSFRDDVNQNMAKFPGIKLKDFVHSGAEDLSKVPDNSVDAVVATAVLCSVKDLQKVFKEIRRVLVPGGKYYYLDHIADQSHTLTYLMQKLVTFCYLIVSYTGLVHAAHLDRKTDQEILKAGFSSVDQKYVNLEMHGKSHLVQLARLLVIGIAKK